MKLKLLFGTLLFSAVNANAQVATIDENFESAVISTPANYNNLVNGWTKKVLASAPHTVYVDQGSGNKYAQFYAAGSTSTDVFLISPQITAPDGTKQVIFTATPTGGSTLEIGLVDNPENLVPNNGVPASYELLQTFTFTATNTPAITPVTIPASTKQYIVFRFRNPQLMGAPGSGVSHAALAIDNIKYNTSSVLATSDIKKSSDQIRFAINNQNTALQFVGKESPKSIEIYSATGSRIAEGAVENNKFDITTIQTGVYFVLIKTKDGKIQKSKFIKN